MPTGDNQRQERVFRTERCDLRPLEESDIGPAYVSWLNDPEVTRFLVGSGKGQATEASVRAYFERFRQSSTTDFLFAIIDRATGSHIGNVTLNHVHPVHRTADTGIMIGNKAFWKKGYAYEAWRAVLEFAFGALELHKIIATSVAENGASIGTLKKLGFKEEGLFRQEQFVLGRWHDVVRLGLLREEFAPTRLAQQVL